MNKPQPITIHKNGDGLFHDRSGNSYAQVTGALPGTIADKLQPHNIEAERAVLGALLIDPDAVLKIGAYLQPADFFIHKHGWIYQAMLDLAGQDQPTDDLILIVDQLRQQGKLEAEALPGLEADLVTLIARTPSSIHVDFYGRLIRRAAILRRLIDTGGEIARLAYSDQADVDDVLDQAESLVFSVSASHKGGEGPQEIKTAVSKYYDRLEYLSKNKGILVGIPSGLSDLDKLLGGFQRSKLYILAGRPGMGKTSFALNVALQAAQKWQKKVAIFSLEMDDLSLVERLLASMTGIDSQRLQLGQIRDGEWSGFIQAANFLSDIPIYIDDTPAISVMELRGKGRRLLAEHGLDMLIVDYLQLMRGDARSENRTQEVSYISRMLKSLARELRIPVLALSQLSRAVENRADKRPMLSDLKESGSIEQDSDGVIFLYRDEVYNPETEYPSIAEVILGKNRGGPTGVLSAYFKKHLSQFVDLELRRIPLEHEPMPDKPELVGGGVKRYAGFRLEKKL